jgi:naphthalene 1,2-dioxygenase ferredoxin reductase component
MADRFKVTLGNTGQVLDCAADRTILHTALTAGIAFPYACATGNCGTCIAELKSGTVALLPHSDTSLGTAQKAKGLTLACRAQPRSDVEIAWLSRAPQP